MTDSIRRELRFLKACCLALSVMMGVLVLGAFQQRQERARFTEIDVERINIVEPDGALRMVIANRPRSIGPIYKGQPFGYPGGSRPGIIFFNDEGTENGGLTFSGRRLADGRYQASSGFSFDQYNQDQILYFQYQDDNGRRRTGLTIADRADVDILELVQERERIMTMTDTVARAAALRRWAEPRNGVPLSAQRLYVGRDPSRNAVIDLSDPEGRPRLRIRVDSLGTPSIEFLDAAGRVTRRLPTGQ